VVYAIPPINLLNSTTIVELAPLVERIEQQADLYVVVFMSENSDFFMTWLHRGRPVIEESSDSRVGPDRQSDVGVRHERPELSHGR
jgi:hypothetical protein